MPVIESHARAVPPSEGPRPGVDSGPVSGDSITSRMAISMKICREGGGGGIGGGLYEATVEARTRVAGLKGQGWSSPLGKFVITRANVCRA